jgi:hypothetical protein
VTVEGLIFERLGLRGALVAVYVSLWIEAAHRKGKFPTTEEYAAWVGKSERQAWRHRAAVHRAFPGDEMEAVVMAAAGSMRNGEDPLRVELPPELARRSA